MKILHVIKSLELGGAETNLRNLVQAFDPKRFNLESAEAIAPTVAVALGLALRRVGDR